MHSRSSSRFDNTAAQLLLRQARQLHRAATSDSTANSLPVLRRLLASQAIPPSTLPDLHRRRSEIQRKHLLRMLALEAGYPSWQTYRDTLKTMPAEALVQFDVLRGQMGYPNLWFSSLAEARAYALEHGGRVVGVGAQGVVIV